jgi:predicted dehydrogenase
MEMVELCQAAGVPLFVAYYRRALPRFIAVREAVASGRIGKPVIVRISFLRPLSANDKSEQKPWRVLPDLSGGGHIWDMGSHALDFMDDVLGPIESASGAASNFGKAYEVEDTICGHFRFANGCLGTGTWGFASGVNEDRLEFIGTEGKLSLSVFGTEPPVLCTGQSEQSLPADTPPHIQQPLIQTIVDQLNGTGTCPSTGVSAARTNWVLEQLVK